MAEETTLLNEGNEEPTTGVVPETTPAVEETASPPAEAVDSKADTVVDGAPDSYETFTFPEGMEADQMGLDKFSPIAKELNLTQDQAQQLVSFESERVQGMIDAQQEAWQTVQNDWVQSAKSDKEIGGPAFNESLANAKTFLGKFATPELMTALDETGMGNHPEFIRAFSRAGKAMKESAMITGGTSEPARTPEQILYPNQSN